MLFVIFPFRLTKILFKLWDLSIIILNTKFRWVVSLSRKELTKSRYLAFSHKRLSWSVCFLFNRNKLTVDDKQKKNRKNTVQMVYILLSSIVFKKLCFCKQKYNPWKQKNRFWKTTNLIFFNGKIFVCWYLWCFTLL